MQSFKLLYHNEYSVYIADGGWCLLSYDNHSPQASVLEKNTCLFFFPSDFIPDKSFCVNAEQFCARIKAKLIWLENPKDSYTFWRCTVSADTSCLSVGVGGCHIHLPKLRDEEADCIVFDGVFHAYLYSHRFPISDAGITLNLKKTTGELSFAFHCDKNTDLFTALNAGVKYVMPLSHDTERGYERNYISSFYNSVLLSDAELTLNAVITPCLLQDCGSTYIALPNATFKSTFLANTGYPVELNALNAKLVLETTAATISYDEAAQTYSYGGLSWYWGIAGGFTSSNKNASSSAMMLGLSSAEYIKANREIQLMFMPHQNALIHHNDDANVKNNLSPSVVTVSWMSFKGAYHSSSESMPLFSVSDNQPLAADNTDHYLRAYIPAVSEFADFSPAFPLMPWKNTTMFNADEAKIAENNLYQNRFGILAGLMQQSAPKAVCGDISDGSVTAIAPCGLCANINPVTCNWNWLGIAQTSNENLPNIRLYALTAKTRSLLQNKECVLLIPTLDEFKALGTAATVINLPVDGWEIVLSAEYWDKDKTLLLMKYSNASTVREIVTDSAQLNDVLSLAYTGEGELKPEYAELIECIDDKNFQGILILGAAALPVNVPDEVKSITSDMKSGEIKAVYTVIDRSRTYLDENGQIMVAKSDISAVFSYKGESITNEKHAQIKLDFRTVGLNTVIKQSVVKQFNSRSELLIADLFGAAITPSNLGGGSCLILNGILETISGTAVYRFSLASPLRFASPNTPISEILFDDLRMIGGAEKTDFVLAGKISLIELEGCDFFSHKILEFSGVKIVKKGAKLTADYALCAVSQEEAVPREGSFAEAFGAKITEIVFCKSDKTPDEMAFSSIMTPVKQGALDKTWNGIVWGVSLGSSGELGASDELSFEIITAWSNQKYYIGLRLPSVLNKNFSLQGLFTAGFSGIDLQKSEDNVLYFRLHGFTLKLLGISIPKKGAELLILGEHGKIAWYMGYEDESEET